MPSKQRMRRTFSVGTKLAVATVAVLAVLSVVLFKELTQRERRRLVEAKAVAGAMVTDLFAASCAAPLVFEDNDAIGTELDKLKSNHAIVFAAVYATGADRTVGQFNPQKRPPFDFKHGKMATQLVESAESIEIVKDIRNTHGDVVGFAVLNFSLADENATYRVSRRRMLWGSLVCTAGTALLLIWLARAVIVKPLGRVTEAARRLERGDLQARADVKSNDEVGNLAAVFNSMGDAIVDREKKVIQAQKNVQDLFDNMLQAVFTVGPDGRIHDEVSAFAKRIFGEVPIAGQLVVDLLRLDAVTDREAVSRMKFWLATIFGMDDFQWELSEPERIQKLRYPRTNAGGKEEEIAIELDYAPIYKDGEIVKIMFLVKDVTEMERLQAEIERRDQQNRENLARIRQIASMEPNLFHTFISEANSVLDSCENAVGELGDPSLRTAAVNSLFRGMHTLKGNARMFKLAAVQDIAHETEDYFQKVRDGEVTLEGEIGAAMRERIGEVRKLLSEFEKLGRQVLGGEQESPADLALSFLRSKDGTFDDWQGDLLAFMDDSREEARVRMLERVTKLRAEAQSHGFLGIVSSLQSVHGSLAQADGTSEQVALALQTVKESFHRTRSLAHEIEAVELWPYFLEEARALMRSLASKLGRVTEGEREHITDASDVVLFAASARAFGLPTLANATSACYRGLGAGTLDARGALKILESCIGDARNLVEMTSRPEMEVDVLARFREDAEDLAERLDSASAAQVGGMVQAAVGCARRYRLGLAQKELEQLSSEHPQDGPLVAKALRGQIERYERIRRELRDNVAAEHLLLMPPVAAGQGERDLETWLAAAAQAELRHLVTHARALSPELRLQLFEDLRHFQVVIPAARGTKSGQPVQRVLEGRIAALRDSLRGLRQAVAHARVHQGAILPPLEDLEKAVVHLTTSSLGDVLAPVVGTAMDLARERGKVIEDVSLEGLDIFMDTRVMQKVRDAIVHVVRNAVDHGLEPSEVRINAGKTAGGRIDILGTMKDGWVEVSVQDDGHGVDLGRVKEIAIKRGLVTAERAAGLSADESHELLFLPGFSTANAVSSVSGRGVGMDAVRAIAVELGGEAHITSVPGRGSRLSLRFPREIVLPERLPSKGSPAMVRLAS